MDLFNRRKVRDLNNALREERNVHAALRSRHQELADKYLTLDQQRLARVAALELFSYTITGPDKKGNFRWNIYKGSKFVGSSGTRTFKDKPSTIASVEEILGLS